MDTKNKIYSSIMCGGLFKIISKYVMKCQFGFTPGFGFQYGTFTIKKLPHIRQNYNLPTWVVFVDLFKDFNTSKNALLIAILVKYGAPSRLCSEIKRMYEKSVVKLIIGKIETFIDYKVVVKQIDSMFPLIFLFLMMAFAKKLEDEWMDLVLSKSQFLCKDNSPRSAGQLVIHRTGTFLYGTIFDLFCMIYVDDGAFVFESRTDIKIVTTLLSD